MRWMPKRGKEKHRPNFQPRASDSVALLQTAKQLVRPDLIYAPVTSRSPRKLGSRLDKKFWRGNEVTIQRASPTYAASRVQQEHKELRIGKIRKRFVASATQNDEKAIRQLDGLFFQGRIVPTEVQKTIRTFWKKSYGRLKGSVKEFFQNKHLCFQQLN